MSPRFVQACSLTVMFVLAGGVPLISEGKIIGAIGLSGGASDQDAQCAQAGANVLK